MIGLDANPEVEAWSSEEVIIGYINPIDGKAHRYFPDFFVRKIDGTKHILEIKPLSQTLPPVPRPRMNKRKFIAEVMEFGKNEAKWKAAEAYCAKRGWNFKVITERDLGITF
jgi:hypothetical protein